LPDTEWDRIQNCWSCKTEGFATNGRGGERKGTIYHIATL